MAGKETEFLCENILRSWKSLVQDRSAKMRRVQGCMTFLIGGEQRLMTCNIWKAWYDMMLETRAQQETSDLKKHLKIEALAMMAGRETELLCENIFRSWKIFAEEIATHMRQAKGYLSALIGKQHRVMIREIWQGWCSVKRAREVLAALSIHRCD
eukprot:gnl/MRDRNA2_/MRDRNA2_84751_c0_seq4.p1 gnl/MRDRNA2_/MRDRNA2_84751_c0~~gnl/MRDRNA2_/MRDRNA2_84751_c0_seq4.p1  ORF type:complete len:180 (+),score=25.42 gnl/MRDRNA2_/MRDRNA2_84751_c0_seq4:77-541(+)